MKYLSFRHLYRSSQRGFTLTEVLVAMFVFSIMMAAVSQVFSTTFTAYRNVRAIQRDIDNAQYSLNILAKELRTSSVVSTNGTVSVVKFYDHSQGKCFQYQINQNKLQVASTDPVPDSVGGCIATTFSSFTDISTGVITGAFRVTSSTTTPSSVGKVTMSLDISEGSDHHAKIQTSVSLRDFSLSGL